MTPTEAQKRYPKGTWIRFYHNGAAVISPVIGHAGGDWTSARAQIYTEVCPVHAEGIVDFRLPPEEDQ